MCIHMYIFLQLSDVYYLSQVFIILCVNGAKQHCEIRNVLLNSGNQTILDFLFILSGDSMESMAINGQIQMCRRGTYTCSKHKLFQNTVKKWLTQLEKGLQNIFCRKNKNNALFVKILQRNRTNEMCIIMKGSLD